METLLKDVPAQNTPAPAVPAAPQKTGRRPAARTCALNSCGKSFTPERASRMYCSEDCAAQAMRDKGTLPQLTKEQKAERTSAGKPKTKGKSKATKASRGNGERSKEAIKKYGPLVKVVKVLKKNEGSFRLLLACKHEKTFPYEAEQAPCQKCAHGSEPDRKKAATK